MNIGHAIITENLKYSEHLVEIPRRKWPHSIMEAMKISGDKVKAVWRSRDFLVQIYIEPNGIERLSIARTTLNRQGHFDDGITWDELMEQKRACGRGERWAVEIYPADDKIVNVANMRHLWVLPPGQKPTMGWL